MDELDRIQQRYERRRDAGRDGLYDPLLPANYLSRQQKEKALVRWIHYARLAPVTSKSLLEVGCGAGGSLLELFRLGFPADRAVGCELRPEALAVARKNLPAAVRLFEGDAAALDLPADSFDVVLQSTVLSSILDDDHQQRVAARMWQLAKRGGGVLSYDFVYNNPRNQDVRGVPLKRLRELFPAGAIRSWRVTLAPPISRRVARLHSGLFYLLEALPFLRTHLLCWIAKI